MLGVTRSTTSRTKPCGGEAVLHRRAGGRDGPARVVSEDDDQPGAEHAGGVLDAPQDLGPDHVVSGTDDEEVPEALVEDDLCGQSRVGASEDDGERVLTGGQLGTAGGVLVRMLDRARYEALVAGEEGVEGGVRCSSGHGRSL